MVKYEYLRDVHNPVLYITISFIFINYVYNPWSILALINIESIMLKQY